MPSNSIFFRDQTYLKMALILEGCRGQNKVTKVDSGASDMIISKLEDYLIKVFGYPRAFLMVLAKASFGHQPLPVVDHESFLQKTWALLREMEDTLNVQTPISQDVTVCTGNPSCYQHKVTQTEDMGKENSSVQITATSAEINRRIQSFIQRKREEVNAYNRREFCVFHDDKQESTCARTDAAYVPRHGKKSLLKTYRVYNNTESTQEASNRKRMKRSNDSDYIWEPNHPSVSLDIDHISPETYQRIDTIEEHLVPKLNRTQKKEKGGAAPIEILQKVKTLENRILFLEGLSPEYFHNNSKGQHVESGNSFHSSDSRRDRQRNVVSIDRRINELRGRLQVKQ